MLWCAARIAREVTFGYDDGVFGPEPEFRRLDDIRRSLRDARMRGSGSRLFDA